jgi:hypothetical protein
MPKLPAQSTRTAVIAKPVTTKGDNKAAAKGRPTARRGVSDENAGVPEFTPSSAEEKAESKTNSKQSTSGKPAASKPVVRKPAAKAASKSKVVEVDIDTPMSTRPTTPSDSPKLAPDDPEEHLPENNVEEHESESDDGAAIEVSGDELCGPKTPMKRLSPHERTKFASAQKALYSEA